MSCQDMSSLQVSFKQVSFLGSCVDFQVRTLSGDITRVPWQFMARAIVKICCRQGGVAGCGMSIHSKRMVSLFHNSMFNSDSYTDMRG